MVCRSSSCRAVPIDVARRIASAIRGACLLVLPACGHVAYFETTRASPRRDRGAPGRDVESLKSGCGQGRGRPGSGPRRRPELGLVLLIDGHPISVRVGHRERPAEGADVWLLEDRDAIRDDALVQRLGVTRPPPQLDRAGRGEGTAGPRAALTAKVGQPTKATASGPKSNVSRTAPRYFS